MKNLWQNILEALEYLAERNKIADDVISLLREENEEWTQMEEQVNPYHPTMALRFEKKGAYYGTIVALDIITAIIKTPEKEYLFGPFIATELVKAAFPQSTERTPFYLSGLPHGGPSII